MVSILSASFQLISKKYCCSLNIFKMNIFIIIISSGVLCGFTQAIPNSFWNPDSVKDVPSLNYTCRGVGNFSHPMTCTQYISCDTKHVAREMDCPICMGDSKRCLDQRLHFNRETRECTGADEAKCGPTKPTAPVTTTTPTPVGGECSNNCTQVGDCACYDTCVPDPTSSTKWRWLKQYCEENVTYWNPDVGPHGGTCDFWDNLSPATQEKYRFDEECPTKPIPCDWRPDVSCANKYFFQPEGKKNSNYEQHLCCPKSPSGQSLFWDQATKTCRAVCSSHPTCNVCPC